MVTINDLKLNRFIPVKMPKNSDYFARFGSFNPHSTSFSGEDDFIPEGQSKLDAIRQADSDYKDFIPPKEE